MQSGFFNFPHCWRLKCIKYFPMFVQCFVVVLQGHWYNWSTTAGKLKRNILKERQTISDLKVISDPKLLMFERHQRWSYVYSIICRGIITTLYGTDSKKLLEYVG